MELTKGVNVFSSTGEKIGTLDRVVLNPGTKEVIRLVVEKGGLFTANKVIPIEFVNMEVGDGFFLKERKLVPTMWLTNVDEDGVNLFVWSDLFDDLPEYVPSIT